MPATLISNIKQQSAHHTFQRGRGFDRSSAASRRPSPRVTRRLGTVGAVDVAAAPSRAGAPPVGRVPTATPRRRGLSIGPRACADSGTAIFFCVPVSRAGDAATECFCFTAGLRGEARGRRRAVPDTSSASPYSVRVPQPLGEIVQILAEVASQPPAAAIRDAAAPNPHFTLRA